MLLPLTIQANIVAQVCQSIKTRSLASFVWRTSTIKKQFPVLHFLSGVGFDPAQGTALVVVEVFSSCSLKNQMKSISM